MSVNEQPSILTVCLPGIAADPGALDLKQILAAREQAALAGRCGGTTSNCSSPDSKCDACDDSACGVDAIAESSRDSSSSFANRRRGTRSSSSDRGVCIGEAPGDLISSGGPSFFHADSGKKALELLRMLRFDLLVTGDRLPDMPVSHLIRRVRAASPWQKWAMVGSNITSQDEIVARSLGAIAVFDAPADWEAIGSLASTAAGRAAVNSNSVPSDIERAGSLQIRDSRVHANPSRGVGKNANSRRAAVLSRSLSDRSVG